MGVFHLTSQLGTLGENLGVRYLKDKGYLIRCTNYCNTSGRRLGEIDIVAEKAGDFIFVEVKSRVKVTGSDVLPEANITRSKLLKLNRIALHYLREQKREHQSYHFDALAILYDPQLKKASIRHLEHIFF